jgi:hypothetical protein
MGKQILATVVLDNTNGEQTIPVSFLSDLIYVKEVQNDDNINSAIYFFGNPNSGLVPKPYIYNVEETVSELVSDSNDSLVECTVIAVDGNGNRLTSLGYAFPTAGFQITESTITGANAAILYRGHTYDVEEEMDDLISAANAGGGGGGGDTLFALTGSNTATGNVTGDLDGNTLTIDGTVEVTDDITVSGGGIAVEDNTGVTVTDSGDPLAYAKISVQNPQANGGYLELSNQNGNIATIYAGDITGTRGYQLADTGGIISASPAPFTGTLADAISGAKSVVNGIIQA